MTTLQEVQALAKVPRPLPRSGFPLLVPASED